MKIDEIRITYKSRTPASERKQIRSSKDASELLRTVFDSDTIQYRETFYCMYLNRANRVLGIQKISEGGTSSTIVDVKMILQGALKTNSHGLILCHNHPSGNLSPSAEDKTITDKIKKAAALLDISLFDHIILTEETHFSFADEQLF